MSKFVHVLAFVSLAFAVPAGAAVTDSTASGFEVSQTYTVNAPADTVYDVLIHPADWWSSDHTFSGDAANLTLDPKAGGCWCERLPDGGSVDHMTVDYAQPDSVLRMEGGLGPLQETGASGHMTVQLAESNGVTTVSVVYDVGGYAKGGLDQLATPVDAVLGQQFANLKTVAEAEVETAAEPVTDPAADPATPPAQ